jgi:hypothetical protein
MGLYVSGFNFSYCPPQASREIAPQALKAWFSEISGRE